MSTDYFEFAIKDTATGMTTIFGNRFRSVAVSSAQRFMEAAPSTRSVVAPPALTAAQSLEVKAGVPVSVPS